jgi:hypothetical protein
VEKILTGSALYYPNIDVRDPEWLRSALLYWDNIYTIVPKAIEKPYQTEDTKICAAEGHLLPLYCDDYPQVIKGLGDRTLELLKPQRPPLPFSLDMAKTEPNLADLLRAVRSRTRVKMHPDKLGNSILYPEKVSSELRDLFIRIEAGESSEWLLVDADFSDIYMAALALLLAEEKDGLAAVTNSSSDHGSAVYALLADSESVIVPQRGVLVSVTMKNLRIDPNAKVQDLIHFKQKRRNQLIDLAAKFDELSGKIKQVEDRKELEKQAKRIYEKDIEREMNRLASELKAASIQSAWDGIYRGMFFTVPAQSVVAATSQVMPNVPGITSSSMMLGAGALLTLTDIAVKNHFARKKARDASKFTYLLDVKRRFSLPSESAFQVLREYEQGQIQ